MPPRLVSALFLLLIGPAANAAETDVSAAQAAALAFAPTQTQPAREPLTVRSLHRWSVAGRAMDYQAAVDEFPIRREGGTLGLVTTYAYTRMPEDAARPVLFLFNGGPGASSWSLHLDGLGPARLDAVHGQFVDNEASLLDTADLVFIDPLGTGASFPFAGADTHALWSVGGDADATLDIVSRWLESHGRAASPVFVLGESYGGSRVAAMLHDWPSTSPIRLKGVVLLSAAIGGLSEADQAIAAAPSLAAAASFHGKGDSQSPGRVGHLDSRRSDDDGSLQQLPPPYNDPGMTLGRVNAVWMAAYLQRLGYRTAHGYRMLNLAINRTWDYGGAPPQWPFAGYVAQAMRDRSDLRVFTAEGLYDLAVPARGTRMALERAHVPADRWENREYPAGHTIGEDGVQRDVLAEDLRRFIGQP